MTRLAAKPVAAILAVVVTLLGLKGIASLAHTSPAMEVVVLPKVEVVASKPAAEPVVADTAIVRQFR